MRLTVHTDYALRVLIYLACRPEELVRVYGLAESLYRYLLRDQD